jgi:hypothetical protein
MVRWVCFVGCWMVLASAQRWAGGGEPGHGCGAKTVLVPRITYANRTEPILTLQPRVHEKTITVLRDVPETRTVKRQVPVLVPEEQTETETYTECRMVEEEVSRDVVVWQPHAEVQEGTRTTSRPVLASETRTILKDVGGWGQRQWVDAHGCRRSCRVWRPKLVDVQITLAVPQLETLETPFREDTVVYKPETKTITERVCRPVVETKTREVTRTVCVEKLLEREFTEVTWRRVADEQVVNYLVPEAVTEQRELPVADRTLVPRTIQCVAQGCER